MIFASFIIYYLLLLLNKYYYFILSYLFIYLFIFLFIYYLCIYLFIRYFFISVFICYLFIYVYICYLFYYLVNKLLSYLLLFSYLLFIIYLSIIYLFIIIYSFIIIYLFYLFLVFTLYLSSYYNFFNIFKPILFIYLKLPLSFISNADLICFFVNTNICSLADAFLISCITKNYSSSYNNYLHTFNYSFYGLSRILQNMHYSYPFTPFILSFIHDNIFYLKIN
jgi:hypothetical protein